MWGLFIPVTRFATDNPVVNWLLRFVIAEPYSIVCVAETAAAHSSRIRKRRSLIGGHVREGDLVSGDRVRAAVRGRIELCFSRREYQYAGVFFLRPLIVFRQRQ